MAKLQCTLCPIAKLQCTLFSMAKLQCILLAYPMAVVDNSFFDNLDIRRSFLRVLRYTRQAYLFMNND